MNPGVPLRLRADLRFLEREIFDKVEAYSKGDVGSYGKVEWEYLKTEMDKLQPRFAQL